MVTFEVIGDQVEEEEEEKVAVGEVEEEAILDLVVEEEADLRLAAENGRENQALTTLDQDITQVCD